MPPKPARTPLLRAIQRIASQVLEKQQQSQDTGGHIVSRRAFLAGSAALTAGLLVGDQVILGAGKSNPRIVIIGAGMAGLNVAWTLKKAGVASTLYEASGRAGGRMMSVSNALIPGVRTEFGGEFIDTNHRDIHSLASEFSLKLLDRRNSAMNELIRQAYFIDGKVYSEEDVAEALRPLLPTLQSHASVLTSVPTFETPGAAEILDKTPLSRYLAELRLPNWLWKLLEAAFVTEYGLELGKQSALNLLITIPTVNDDGSVSMFGDSDERYKIAGGNASLPEAIASRLNSQIRYSSVLKSVSMKSGRYQLEFVTSGASQTTEADIVVLAIPFSVLRGVTLDLDLPDWKTRAIRELPYGTNTKVMMGFSRRIWREKGFVGEVFSDEQFQLAWDNTELEHSPAGALTIYTGGDAGVEATKIKLQAQVESYLELLEKIFPGISNSRNSKQARMNWIGSPFSKGSYASYGPGHWTTIRGAEFKPIGNLHFAGEHCSLDFQGFMNGAAETGRRAAENILASLK